VELDNEEEEEEEIRSVAGSDSKEEHAQDPE
jgi:hypothetical protein